PVLAALMAKDPADRPTADEAARMLAEVQAGHTTGFKTVAPMRAPTQSEPTEERGAAGETGERPAPPRGTAGLDSLGGAAGGRRNPVAPVPFPDSPPHSLSRGKVTLVIVAIALAVGLALASGDFLVTRQVAGPAAADPAPNTPTVPAPTMDPDPEPTAPDGYHWVDDPAGFRFPLPSGTPAWQRSTTSDNQIYYSPDNKTHYLQFAVTVGQSVKPLDHMRQMETTVSKSLKDYKQHKMTGVALNGHEAAVWEFSYAALGGGRRRAVEAEFINDDGTGYAIYLSCPDTDWPEGERRFTAVLNHFTPTR
ncbi:hypothetical protein ACF1GP_39010, partial [Kitasatospora aureofaciens]